MLLDEGVMLDLCCLFWANNRRLAVVDYGLNSPPVVWLLLLLLFTISAIGMGLVTSVVHPPVALEKDWEWVWRADDNIDSGFEKEGA